MYNIDSFILNAILFAILVLLVVCLLVGLIVATYRRRKREAASRLWLRNLPDWEVVSFEFKPLDLSSASFTGVMVQPRGNGVHRP